jgi:hypothetical protein
MSSLALAQLFQKCSRPDKKWDPLVSSQGNSSKKMTFFPVFHPFPMLHQHCHKPISGGLEFA